MSEVSTSKLNTNTYTNTFLKRSGKKATYLTASQRATIHDMLRRAKGKKTYTSVTTTKSSTVNTNYTTGYTTSAAAISSIFSGLFGLGSAGLGIAKTVTGMQSSLGTSDKSSSISTVNNGSTATTIKGAIEQISTIKTTITNSVNNIGAGTDLESCKLGDDISDLKDIGLQPTDDYIENITNKIESLKNVKAGGIEVSEDGTITDSNKTNETLDDLGKNIETATAKVESNISLLNKYKITSKYKDENVKAKIDKALEKMTSLKTELEKVKNNFETAKTQYNEKCQALKDAQAQKQQLIKQKEKEAKQLLKEVESLETYYSQKKDSKHFDADNKASYNKMLNDVRKQYTQLLGDKEYLQVTGQEYLTSIEQYLGKYDKKTNTWTDTYDDDPATEDKEVGAFLSEIRGEKGKRIIGIEQPNTIDLTDGITTNDELVNEEIAKGDRVIVRVKMKDVNGNDNDNKTTATQEFEKISNNKYKSGNRIYTQKEVVEFIEKYKTT